MNKNVKYALLINPILNLVSCYDDYDTYHKKGGLDPSDAASYAWEGAFKVFFSFQNVLLFLVTLLFVWVIRLFFAKA
jgi:hypothetical protein